MTTAYACSLGCCFGCPADQQGLAQQSAKCLADQNSLPCWSAALSRALCLVHKLQGDVPASRTDVPKPRILCINGSPDVPGQYIAVMNAIFSAQVCHPLFTMSVSLLCECTYDGNVACKIITFCEVFLHSATQEHCSGLICVAFI